MTIAQVVWPTSLQVRELTPSYSVAAGCDVHREILFVTACLVERLCGRKLPCNARFEFTTIVNTGSKVP